ncbi:helix-turn-helix transcriptional regulator [Dongia deserti]|uniref:helix-turn-helix transcriptional regulator n=1 Tax=Dongia deserti TaxID=2268030 RepID=UPI000E648D79|nr:metalloregulator ArsR/SmtB family transcription factor [Dongia deserti]
MEDKGATRVLYALKSAGPQSADALARRLKVTVVAARQQLGRLLDKGLVTFEDRREGVGRPKRVWSLSEAGNARFPDSHAAMTVDVIQAISAVFGPEGLERVIAEREKVTRRLYAERLRPGRSLAERAKLLAEQRAEEGYMAEVKRQPDGSLLLIENHCPICVAAKACQGFCRSELNLFRDTLGSDAKVEREEHILAGARRCAYRITAGK